MVQAALLPCAAAVPLARRPAASSTQRCSRLQPLLAQQRAARRLVAARAEEESSSGAAAAAQQQDDDGVAAEQLLRRRKGGKGGDDKAGGKKQAGPTVISPLRDQVYGGGPLTAEQRAENSVVALLAVLFFVILAEGVFLAASGFLPEGMDQFAQDIVFPAFTPTLAVFLAISTGYGLWKTRSAPAEGGK